MPVVIEMSVLKELEKHPEIAFEDITKLREWIRSQPHLPHEYITDLDIILAYHSCERNMNNTKKVIDCNFTLRTLFSFYQDRKVNTAVENALRTWLITPLKTKSIKEDRAIYCQLLDADTSKFVYSDVVRAFVMIVDLWQLEEGTAPGVVVIVNMDRVSPGHLYKIDLEAMFVRLKEFHFINAPSFIDRLLFMVKPFMKEDLLHKLKVHTVGSNTLDEYIDTTEFFKEVAEISSEGERDIMWNRLKENTKYFEEESKKRVDETKRLDKSVSMGNIFSGMEETFRSLEID
ncbi:uncharacterized protein isoform X2 [Choristoneura fumiferana]|uniref:uncharacterized protein isoform X2 n=1 Tax=Choristoneura fumiferana TaxID=7141 RepID=UPI003D15754B